MTPDRLLKPFWLAIARHVGPYGVYPQHCIWANDSGRVKHERLSLPPKQVLAHACSHIVSGQASELIFGLDTACSTGADRELRNMIAVGYWRATRWQIGRIPYCTAPISVRPYDWHNERANSMLATWIDEYIRRADHQHRRIWTPKLFFKPDAKQLDSLHLSSYDVATNDAG